MRVGGSHKNCDCYQKIPAVFGAASAFCVRLRSVSGSKLDGDQESLEEAPVPVNSITVSAHLVYAAEQ